MIENHKGDTVVMLNAYQCYTKRMNNVMDMEVKAKKAYNFNLGVKMVRGAYMDEERRLAKE